MTKKNTVATIVTIAVAVLALATTMFLLYKMSQNDIEDENGTFIPTEELNNEMNDNAVALVKNNCEVFRVFLQYGLAHESEPYNNLPEDGLYTVKSDDYKSMSDLENLVNNTFVEKEADRILENVNDKGAVYKSQEDGTLGLNSEMVDENGRFKAYDYNYSWTNAKLTLKPVSETECQLTIELEAKETDENSQAGDNKQLSVAMLKVNGKWLLQKLAY